jgi:UDP-N-acetylglucosamine 1-carboxyvinyltransferase
VAGSAEKIGQLISQVRLQRGLTQSELAEKLKTSQSAVNRIEKGNQNVSLEMLGRISEVLNKEIVQIGNNTVSFKVEGGRELSGSIQTKVSKNATVAILCASLLNKGTTVLKKVPKIEEVYRILEVLQSIGVRTKWINDDLEISRPAKLNLHQMDVEAARKTRTVIMFLGPLLHEFEEFEIPFAGGCKLGKRTVGPHFSALENFGLSIHTTDDEYQVKSQRLTPSGPVVLSEMSETATENAIMAAARTDGTTEIRNASHNYMVRDLCYFLQDMGIEIEGVGTNTLRIHGQKNVKKNFSYSAAEDPIEAMAFLSIAATTNSEITIERAPIEFLQVELLKLRGMGCKYEIGETYIADNGRTELADIRTKKHDELVAPDDKLLALPFPGINMDNLPFFVPIACLAEGRTLVHDWSYENRAIYFTELNKLGASLTLADPHRVYVDGPTEFKAADIVSPPALRPAVIVLIAMLAADGTSVLRNVYSIARGYEDLANRLNKLGANIKVLHEI